MITDNELAKLEAFLLVRVCLEEITAVVVFFRRLWERVQDALMQEASTAAN
jgi:hypothetical protein